MRKIALLITCEHGGNKIPSQYAVLFKNSGLRLRTHEGYDKGALAIAKALSKIKHLPQFFIYSETSRLLIDLNRSINNQNLFSNITAQLTAQQKKAIIAYEYQAHWATIEEKIKAWHGQGYTVLHIASHSFTPLFKGKIRKTEIGLLYDPARILEKETALTWRKELHALSDHSFNIHFNRPYQGKSDGLATALRKKFKKNYMGFELEINQRLFDGGQTAALERLIRGSVEKLLKNNNAA